MNGLRKLKKTGSEFKTNSHLCGSGLLGRYLGQSQLVQPSNVTVITGIAVEATGTDRVHVLVRKDTRRFRYRTSVIVNNILRYFDTMQLQRFKGQYPKNFRISYKC